MNNDFHAAPNSRPSYSDRLEATLTDTRQQINSNFKKTIEPHLPFLARQLGALISNGNTFEFVNSCTLILEEVKQIIFPLNEKEPDVLKSVHMHNREKFHDDVRSRFLHIVLHLGHMKTDPAEPFIKAVTDVMIDLAYPVSIPPVGNG